MSYQHRLEMSPEERIARVLESLAGAIRAMEPMDGRFRPRQEAQVHFKRCVTNLERLSNFIDSRRQLRSQRYIDELQYAEVNAAKAAEVLK